MKKNIFQKQDESEAIPTVENTQATENTAQTVNKALLEPPVNHGTDIINLVNINQVYTENKSSNVVFKDFNLDIKDIKDYGQFITIMGKSGYGKSTLLRYISGFTGTNVRGGIYLW